MTVPFRLDFDGGGSATAVRVSTTDQLGSALGALGLQPPRPTVVVIGGAGGLDEAGIERLRPVFASAIVPVMEAHDAVGIDGGTLSGVMRLFGEARSAAGAGFPLLGVVAKGTVQLPEVHQSHNRPELEPRHSHFIIVPGDHWGDESSWIASAATTLAGNAPSITVLLNGGQIAYTDVERSIEARREVVVITGSGRTADALAAALTGAPSEERAVALTGRGLIRAVSADDPAGLAQVLTATLSEPKSS